MSTKEGFEVKKGRRRFSLGGYVFIALTLYGIFFLVSGISHLSQALSASTGAGEKFWWIAKGLSIILVLFIVFLGVKKYRKPSTSKKAGATEDQVIPDTNNPPFFFPLLTGLVWPGLPVLAGFGLVAYAISPSLVQVPNMLMVPTGAIALYYALRSAVRRSKTMTSQGKEEFNSGLVSTRSVVGKITLILLLLGTPGYYNYYSPPGTFTELFKGSELSGLGKKYEAYQAQKERLAPSVSEENLPTDTLLDPGLSTSEVGDWIVKMDIHNPYITIGGIKSGNRLTINEGSYITDHLYFSVVSSAGHGVLLSDGNCKKPTKESIQVHTPKTCTGNWHTLDNSIRGVYALVFKNTGKVFTVDLYTNDVITGDPDIKLIAQKNEE